jgi:transposase
MMIIGCDYHPGFQQIARLDTETGELRERRLAHREEAEAFYRDLGAQGVRVRLGMEASGQRCGIRDGNLPASYGLV